MPKKQISDETRLIVTSRTLLWQSRARLIEMAIAYLTERLAGESKKPSDELIKKARTLCTDQGLMVSKMPLQTEELFRGFTDLFFKEMASSHSMLRSIRGLLGRDESSMRPAMEALFAAISGDGSDIEKVLINIQDKYAGHKPAKHAKAAYDDACAYSEYIGENFDELFTKLSYRCQEAPTVEKIVKLEKKIDKMHKQRHAIEARFKNSASVTYKLSLKDEKKIESASKTTELLSEIQGKLSDAVISSITWRPLLESIELCTKYHNLKSQYFKLKAESISFAPTSRFEVPPTIPKDAFLIGPDALSVAKLPEMDILYSAGA